MDNLGTLSNTMKENQRVIIIKNLYGKMTQALPTARITIITAAFVFFKADVVPYGFISYILTKNGTHFVSEYYKTLCSHLEMKHFAKTVYHMQTNSQSNNTAEPSRHVCVIKKVVINENVICVSNHEPMRALQRYISPREL